MATFVKIASVSLSSAASSIDFTSIPATYTDLQVMYSLRTSLTGGPYQYDDLGVRLNTDTGSNYSRLTLVSRQGTIGSNKTSPTSFMDAYATDATDATANIFGNGYFYIPNYAGSSYKTLSSDGVTENNSASDVITGFSAGLWSSTSAVTSIKIYSQNGTNFVQYSTATLYGISNS